MSSLDQGVLRRHLLAGAGAASLLSACGTPPRQNQGLGPDMARRLAPSGRLRAAINFGNPILARRNPANGEALGVSVDLAQALAAQLGVQPSLVLFESAGRAVEAVKASDADIGFFAIDPLRSDGIGFTAPYLFIEGAYLVRENSPLRDNAEVDRAGQRVMVGKGSAYDLYLSRNLRAAQLMYSPTSPQVVDQFLAQNADVAAGVKQQLQADAARLGGVRLLPGRFMVIEQAMGLPLERGDAAIGALRRFVEWAKSSGLVAQSLQRHGISGAVVAPAA